MTELAPIPVFLVIFHAFCRLLIFSQILNSLYLDQARLFVKPDLGPNCLPRLLADGSGR